MARHGHGRRKRRSLSRFFLLTAGLFVPFWTLGAVRPVDLLPGLPIAALATFMPAVSAGILRYGEEGGRGVASLAKRSFDFGRTRRKAWLVPAVLLMPAVMLVAFGLLRATGYAGPLPRITLRQTLALSVVFFIGALGEELGWSGYAIDPMQERRGPLRAALLLGFAWAAYHLVALLQVGRPPLWITFWTLQTVGLRVLITWLYDNTDESVFAASVFHAAGNVTWQLFAVDGTIYYPILTSLVTTTTAAAVVAVYGPALVRSREITAAS